MCCRECKHPRDKHVDQGNNRVACESEVTIRGNALDAFTDECGCAVYTPRRVRLGDHNVECPVHNAVGRIMGFFEYVFTQEEQTQNTTDMVEVTQFGDKEPKYIPNVPGPKGTFKIAAGTFEARATDPKCTNCGMTKSHHDDNYAKNALGVDHAFSESIKATDPAYDPIAGGMTGEPKGILNETPNTDD